MRNFIKATAMIIASLPNIVVADNFGYTTLGISYVRLTPDHDIELTPDSHSKLDGLGISGSWQPHDNIVLRINASSATSLESQSDITISFITYGIAAVLPIGSVDIIAGLSYGNSRSKICLLLMCISGDVDSTVTSLGLRAGDPSGLEIGIMADATVYDDEFSKDSTLTTVTLAFNISNQNSMRYTILNEDGDTLSTLGWLHTFR